MKTPKKQQTEQQRREEKVYRTQRQGSRQIYSSSGSFRTDASLLLGHVVNPKLSNGVKPPAVVTPLLTICFLLNCELPTAKILRIDEGFTETHKHSASDRTSR